jgi:hypothetical protein
MRYIKKIILENFQSHKNTEMEFGPDLNVIVGPSDSGKSAIIRGLKWVMYNEPSGDFFIREGEKECRVTLELSDGTLLQRYRTKSKNGYKLIDNSGNENIYEGIGLTVPQEIIDVTGIRKIKLDTDSENAINLGEQLEGAFLLTEKASTRANAIGRLVGVDIVDDALRDVLRDIRSLNQTRKQKEETLQITNDKLSQFDYIDEIKETYSKASSLMEQVHSLNGRIEKLEGINRNLTGLSVEIFNNNAVLKDLENITEAETILVSLKSKLDILSTYDRISKLYRENMINRDKLKNTIRLLSKFVEKSPLVTTTELRVYKLTDLQRLAASVKKVDGEVERINIVAKKLEKIEHTTNLINSADILSLRYKELKSMRDKFYKILNSKERGILYLREIQPLLDAKKELQVLEDGSTLLKELSLYQLKYSSIKKETLDLQSAMDKNDENLKNILEKYRNLLQQVEKCPYCLGDIDENTIEHIITHHLGG